MNWETPGRRCRQPKLAKPWSSKRMDKTGTMGAVPRDGIGRRSCSTSNCPSVLTALRKREAIIRFCCVRSLPLNTECLRPVCSIGVPSPQNIGYTVQALTLLICFPSLLSITTPRRTCFSVNPGHILMVLKVTLR